MTVCVNDKGMMLRYLDGLMIGIVINDGFRYLILSRKYKVKLGDNEC